MNRSNERNVPANRLSRPTRAGTLGIDLKDLFSAEILHHYVCRDTQVEAHRVAGGTLERRSA